jgi:hypothetical protein
MGVVISCSLAIGVLINLIVPVERLRSSRLREATMKDLEHSRDPDASRHTS